MAIKFWFNRDILDADWAGHAFRVNPDSFSEDAILDRMKYTTSTRKFTDTSLGGSFEVNPHPQFTRNCDFAHSSLYFNRGKDSDTRTGLYRRQGNGRWKSEVLDDNQQVIHIRAGIPVYNDMYTFFTNFFHMKSSILSRRGRADSLWYMAGSVVGTIVSLPVQPFIIGGAWIKFMLGMPRTKFYYLRPSMHMYHKAVANMMGTYMVNAGLTTLFVNEGDEKFHDPGSVDNVTNLKEQLRIYGKSSGLLTKSGAFDIFAVGTRAQRLAKEYRDNLEIALKNISADGTPVGRNEYIRKINDLVEDTIIKLPDAVAIDGRIADKSNAGSSQVEGGKTPDSLLDHYINIFYNMLNDAPAQLNGTEASGFGPETLGIVEIQKGEGEGESATSASVTSVKNEEEQMSWWKKLTNTATSSMEMGAEFVSFRINPTGTHSESFSNSFGESGLMETINQQSASARSARFNIADGNIAGPIGSIISAATEAIGGVLDSVSLSGAFALGGSAFIDVQKVYQNSSNEMMSTSVTIPLRAWSADPWTIAKDIMYPLFSILALGLPKSTGNQSYDEPFLMELFLQGRSQMRECRVRSISITRGVGDIGWNRNGQALGIDVTIDFEDMSGVMGVPINPDTNRIISTVTGAIGVIGGETVGNFADSIGAAMQGSSYSEDNKFGDYMNVLSAVSLYNQINTYSGKLKMNLARTRANMEQWRSPSAIVSGAFDTLPGVILQAIGKPTSRNG